MTNFMQPTHEPFDLDFDTEKAEITYPNLKRYSRVIFPIDITKKQMIRRLAKSGHYPIAYKCRHAAEEVEVFCIRLKSYYTNLLLQNSED
jgi:hypothetical protein